MYGCRPLIVTALLVLAGCASGIQPGGNFPSQTFDVAAPYDAAYRRAAEFVRVCHIAPEHPYGVQFGDSRFLEEKTATAEVAVYKIPEPVRRLEIIRAQPKGKVDSTVTVTVLGEDVWDAAEIAAARQSIQTATPVCRTAPR
jgi:hypothetical protein